jgi:hypothetical protein
MLVSYDGVLRLDSDAGRKSSFRKTDMILESVEPDAAPRQGFRTEKHPAATSFFAEYFVNNC